MFAEHYRYPAVQRAHEHASPGPLLGSSGDWCHLGREYIDKTQKRVGASHVAAKIATYDHVIISYGWGKGDF